MADHLADDSSNLSVRQLEHRGEGTNGESVVVGSVCEEICPQTFLLDLFGEHGFDGVGFCHEFPDLDRVDELGGFLPFAGC